MIPIALNYDDAGALVIGISRSDIMRMALDMETGPEVIVTVNLAKFQEATDMHDIAVIHVAIGETEDAIAEAFATMPNVYEVRNIRQGLEEDES